MYKESDTEDNVVTFESGDSLSFDSWTDVDILESGENHKSIFHKLSTMVKNIRYLYKLLGTTDISSIDNGTVTGGLNYLNTETSTLKKSVADGKSSVAAAISAQGYAVAADAAFDDLVFGVSYVADSKYDEGYDNGYGTGYNKGVTDADNRENSSSINYQSGYNAGVAAADGRVNTSSTNYISGYNQGEADGNAACLEAIKNGTSRLYYGITVAYNKYYKDTGRYEINAGIYPTATTYSKILFETECSAGSGYKVKVIAQLWCGVRDAAGWHSVGSWYF